MLILFFLFLFECGSSRWDFIQTIYSPSGSSDGSWRSDVYCPSGTWARGYQHRTDPNENSGDDFGTDTVRFFCYDYSGAKITYIDSNGQNWGSWSSEVTCAGSQNFIIGYQLKNWDSSDVSVTGVQIMCSDHQSQNAGHEYPRGGWKAWGICPAGTALCGQLSRWEDAQYCLGIACYNTALNDLKIYCCRICDEANARFVNPSTLNCDQCHYTCKTCSGSGISQCKSCYHSDTLTSNSCPGPTYLYEKTFEDPPSGWAGATTTNCGILTNIVGGYNTFGKDQSITKTFSNFPPFFKTRIRVRYIKIDSWDAETAKLDVNGVNIINFVINWNDGFLFGDQCGLSNYNEYALMIELETNTNKNVVSFPVKIYSGLDSVGNDEWWGVGDFYLGVLKCHVTCKTCTGPNSNECDGCYPNASLQPDNTCVCDDTYYAVSVSTCTSYPCTTCTPCYTGCKKCSGPNNIDCSSCVSYYYFLVNRCYGGYCPSPKCGNNVTWTCDTICASTNQFIDLADRICKPCDPTCLTCSERQSINCLTCGDPRFHTIGSGDGECVTSCPIPRFAHEPTRICQVKCPDPTWGRETTSRICSDSCLNTNEYKDSTDRICKACNPYCSTCKGSSTSDCLSCSGTRYLYGNQCLTDCLAGKYGKSSTNTCEDCNTNCETCETPDQPTKCLSCEVPYYLKSTGNLCVSTCLINEYEDDTDRKCKTCPSDCATCFGGLATNCLTCTGSLNFYEPDNTCISSCPSPYYAYLNLCQKTCPSGLFGKSITSRICEAAPCLTDEFADPTDRICRKCHTDCLTCSGLTSSDCSSCGGLLYQKGSTCISNCGTSFYGKTAVNHNTCEACTNNCFTCKTPDGPSYCLSCTTISSTMYFLNAATCITACPSPLWGRPVTFTCENTCLSSHQFGDPNDNRICKECPTKCLTCDEFGCLTCGSGLYFYQKDCLSKCPTDLGYWDDPTTNTCQICHPSCKTCSKSGEGFCLSCTFPAYLQNNICVTKCETEPKMLFADSQLGTCVEKCQVGYYEEKVSQTCMRCDGSCLTCSNGTSDACTSCKLPLILTPDKGTCSIVCPFHYFKQKLSSGVYSDNCTICDETCGNCNTVKEKCDTCAPGLYPYYLASWLCVPCTEVQQYRDPTDNICKLCNVAYCRKCKTMDLCDECLDIYYIELVNDKDFCLLKTTVEAKLESVSNPKLFKISFSEKWTELFDNLKLRTDVSIEGLNSSSYNYVLYAGEQANTFFLQITFYRNVTEKSKLSIFINSTFKTEASKYYNLSTPLLVTYLAGYVPCEPLKYWDWNSKTCLNALAITPTLNVDMDPQDLTLLFDVDCPTALMNELEADTKITIPNLDVGYSHQYTFFVGDFKKVKLLLEYKGRFANEPVLFLEFKLSNTLQQDESFYFTKNPINITLPKFYGLTNSEKQSLKNMAATSKTGNQVARVLMIMQTLLNVGSSFAVKSMVVMDLMKFLRFVNISYPPNAKEIFNLNFSPPDVFELINVIPKLELEEDPRDKQPGGLFQEYGISSYLLNNHGNYLVNCVSFLLIGFLINFLSSFMVTINNRIFQIVFTILSNIFVWNYILTFYLSSHQTSLLYVAISLDYYSTDSEKGIANLIITTIFAMILVLMPILIYKKLNKFQEIKIESNVDDQLKVAELNARGPSRFSLFFFQKSSEKKRQSILSKANENNKSKESEVSFQGNPLLDIEGLPKRKSFSVNTLNQMSNNLIDDKIEFSPDESEKNLLSNRTAKESPRKNEEPTYVDVTEKELPIFKDETADTFVLEKKPTRKDSEAELQDVLKKKRSSFVNLWEMLRKKKPEKPIPRKSKSERKSLKTEEQEKPKTEPKPGSEVDKVDKKEIKIINLDQIPDDQATSTKDHENTSEILVEKESNNPLKNEAQQQQPSEIKEKEPEKEMPQDSKAIGKEMTQKEEEKIIEIKQESPRNEENKPESTGYAELESPQISRKKKGHLTRLIENVAGSDETEEELEPISEKGSQNFNQKEGNSTKFGRKSFGKIVPWEEAPINMKNVRNMDAEKGGTIFGRKSRGKITPWEEISGSFLYNAKSLISHMNRPLSKHEFNIRYQALNKDFSSASKFKRNFLLMDIIRQFVIVCSIVYLPNWPLTSVSLITTINSLLILLICIMRPYNSLITLLQVIFNELCLLTGCTASLYLALLDKNNDFDYNKRLLAGWFIVYANLILIYFFISMIFLQFFADIRKAIHTAVQQYENKFKSRPAIERYRMKRLKVMSVE